MSQNGSKLSSVSVESLGAYENFVFQAVSGQIGLSVRRRNIIAIAEPRWLTLAWALVSSLGSSRVGVLSEGKL